MGFTNANSGAGPSTSTDMSTFSMDDAFYDNIATAFSNSNTTYPQTSPADYRNAASGMGEMSHMTQHSARQQYPPQGMSSTQQQLQQPLVDNDTIEMWSIAPTGFELDDRGTYLSNVSEFTGSGGVGQPQERPHGI